MPAKLHLKDKEVRQLVREFEEHYPTSKPTLDPAKDFEELQVEGSSVFFVNGRPLILRTQNMLLPSLKFDEVVNSLPKVVVDMGAVAHLANGAHLMRPGIREIKTNFAKGALVCIVDEKHGKSIALGISDMESDAIRAMSKGKVIANIHYVGDELWKSLS